jgi:hypothetical protein
MSRTFGGNTFDPALDEDRLRAQLAAVRKAVSNGNWWTLARLAQVVDAPEASVSARLRDLRKPKFGGFTVERRRVPGGNGLHIYRVPIWQFRQQQPPQQPEQPLTRGLF